MGTKAIEKILIRACEALGLVPLSRIYLPEDFPEGAPTDCIVIHVKEQARGEIFYRGFAEVNAVYPDDNGRSRHELLEHAESVLHEAFKYDTVVDFEGSTYRYGLNSISVHSEPNAHYHYVNARLLVESLNI